MLRCRPAFRGRVRRHLSVASKRAERLVGKRAFAASSWYPPCGFGPRGQAAVSESGPVSFTSNTLGTARQTSVNVVAETV